MDFKKATDELMARVTRNDIAEALGCSEATVRQAKLDDGAKAHRSPPEGWERAVAQMAERQANRLQRLSQRLLEQSAK